MRKGTLEEARCHLNNLVLIGAHRTKEPVLRPIESSLWFCAERRREQKREQKRAEAGFEGITYFVPHISRLRTRRGMLVCAPEPMSGLRLFSEALAQSADRLSSAYPFAEVSTPSVSSDLSPRTVSHVSHVSSEALQP